jgi:hypothetical protein
MQHLEATISAIKMGIHRSPAKKFSTCGSKKMLSALNPPQKQLTFAESWWKSLMPFGRNPG